MLQGETRLVKYTERATTPFTISSSPTVAVTKPDGTLVSPAPTATTVPDVGVASTNYILQAPVVFTIAGYYQVEWRFVVGTETNIRRQAVFAYWTDVPASLKFRLANSRLTDVEIDRMASDVVRRLLDRWTCIGDYDDLVGQDRNRFDDGLAYMLAANMQLATQRGGPIGLINLMKQGDLTLQFERGSNPALSFLYQAAQNFAKVSCVADMFSTMATNYKTASAVGPTRNQVAHGIMPSMITTLATLLDADALYASGTL